MLVWLGRLNCTALESVGEALYFVDDAYYFRPDLLLGHRDAQSIAASAVAELAWQNEPGVAHRFAAVVRLVSAEQLAVEIPQ